MSNNKIVINFTSPTLDEYAVWNDCDGKAKGNGWQIYAFSGRDVSYHDKGAWLLNKVQKVIQAKLKSHNDDSVAILFHDTEAIYHTLKSWCATLNEKPICIGYSSGTGLYYDKLKAIAQWKTDDSFNELWQLVEESLREDRVLAALRFRYDILSPLVALDLLIQSKHNNNAADQEIQSLLSNNGSENNIVDSIRDAIKKIGYSGNITNFCSTINCKSFRFTLENLLNPYSNTTVAKYRKDLETVTAKIEEQIAAI